MDTSDYTLGGAGFSLPQDEDINIPSGTIIGDFVVGKKIGSGGCGVVYKAWQQSISRDVALKLILPKYSSPAILERFELEKRALGRLRHENIVNVIAGGKTEASLGNLPFFAMEYVDGQPITEYANKKRLLMSGRLGLFSQVCEAVQHAHEHGVIHRDIKPTNVLVIESNGEALVKVIDFGIAKVINDGLPAKHATRTDHIPGTLAYMAPEQKAGDPNLVTEKTDIYALGLLLRELTREIPLDQNDAAKSTTNLQLIQVITKCLEEAPSQRFKSAAEIALAVEELRTAKYQWPPKPVLASIVTILILVVCFGLLKAFQGSNNKPLTNDNFATVDTITVDTVKAINALGQK